MKKWILRWLRRLGLGFGILVLLLFLAWALRWPLFGGMIRDAVTDALAAEGIRAEIGGMSGTLLGGVTVKDFRVVDAPGHPEIARASLDRVHASYSLFGLLRGKAGWIELVEVRGLDVSLDLARALPAEEPPPEEEVGGGFDRTLLPAKLVLADFDIEVQSGANRFELDGASLVAESGPTTIRGTYGAARAHVSVEGEERTGQPVSGEFDLTDDVFTVTRFEADGVDHGQVIRADLSRLDEDRIETRIRLPLLDGRLEVDAALLLSGEAPTGTARVALVDMDPGPALRFVSGNPVQLERIDAWFDVTLPEGGAPDLTNIAATFEITLGQPGYDVWGADAIRLEGGLAEGRIRVEGRFEGPDGALAADISLTGEERVLATVDFPTFDLALLKQAPEGLPIRGTARISARAEGPIESPDLRADIRVEGPRFGHFDADVLELVADGTPEKSFLRHLLVTRGDDRLVVTGVVEPVGDVHFEGEVKLEIGAVEDYVSLLPEDVPKDVAGSLSVAVTASGTPEAPGAKALITMEEPRGAGFAADRLLIEAEVPDIETFSATRIELRAAADLVDLEIADALVAIDATGDATVTVGRAAFSRREWGLAGNLTARMNPDGSARATITLETLDVAALAADLDLGLSVGGIASGTIEIGGTVEAPELDGKLAVSAPSIVPDGRPEVVADDMVLAFSHRGGVARLEELSLGGPGWAITGSGAVPFDLENPDATADAPFEDVRIGIRALPLALAGPVPGLADARGTLSGNFTVSGTAAAPAVSGALRLEGGAIVLEDMPDLPIEGVAFSISTEDLATEGGSVRLEHLRADVLGAHIEASGETRLVAGGLAEPRIDLTVSGAELGRILGVFAPDVPVRGMANLNIEVRPEPRISVRLGVKDLEIAGQPDCSLDIEADWRDGTFSIGRGIFVAHGRKLSISGRAPLDLTLAPFAISAPLDRPLDLAFTSEGIELEDLVAGEQEIRLAGRAFVDVAVRGTYGSPRPEGTVTIEDARARLPGAPALSDLDATILLSPEQITVKSLEGRLGGGKLTASGTVAMADGKPAAVDLALHAANAQLVRDAGLRLRADLDLTVRGPSPESVTVAGGVLIRSLRAGGSGLFAAQDLELLLASLRSQPSLAPLPLTTDPVLKGVKLDVEVTIPPETARIRNNLVNLGFDGKLKVGGTLAVPRPDGRIYLAQGGVVYLVAGSLEIDRGVVTFKAAEPLRPYVQIRAAANISGTEIYVDVSGSANDPKILFSSIPPMDESNLVSLLLTGATRDQLGSSGAALGLAQAYLVRQLSSNLSSDDGEEPSGLSDIVRRVDVEVDTNPAQSGGTPAIRATLELLEWLFVRVSQEAENNYGADLILRITRP